jgi:methylase of polypeptide subunit release factors
MKTLYLAKEPGTGVRDDLSRIQGEVTVVDCLNAYGDYYRKMGYNCISKDDFFRGVDMEFDVIVGNPPYQDGSKDTSYNQLWAEFFVQSFSMLKPDGVQILIHPATWATPKDVGRKNLTNTVTEIIRNHAHFINYLECGKHFRGVGSTFSLTKVTKQPNNGSCKVVTPEESFEVSKPSEFVDNVLSKDNSKIAISIVNKIRNHSMLEPHNKDKSLVGDIVPVKDDSHLYRVQYAATTEKWSNVKHPLQDAKKILFANQTSKNYPVYDAGISAPCNRGAIFMVSSDKEGENIVETMKTTVMNFFFSRLRFHHGLLNTAVINCIPNLNYDKVWSDEELAIEFGLTTEELFYIQTTV